MLEKTTKFIVATRNLLKRLRLLCMLGAELNSVKSVIPPVEIINCAIKAISDGVVKFTDDAIYIPTSLIIYVSESSMAAIQPHMQTFMAELDTAVKKHITECLCTAKNSDCKLNIDFKVDMTLPAGAIRCDAELHDQLP